MFEKRGLPSHVIDSIEQVYQYIISNEVKYAEVITQKYLSGGNKGAVYLLSVKTRPDQITKMCVKQIANDNYTAQPDFENCKAMYDKDFLFSFCKDNANSYYTMPFFPGESLETLIKNGHLDEETRLEIFKKIVLAVNVMHGIGVIHRDIKAANIIVNYDSAQYKVIDVKIIDFGRSIRIFDGDPHSLRPKTGYVEDLALANSNSIFTQIRRHFQKQTPREYLGMPIFLKSENQASVRPGDDIGFRSDYYSMGVLFKALVPEKAHLAQNLVKSMGVDRDAAYYQLLMDVGISIEELTPKKAFAASTK